MQLPDSLDSSRLAAHVAIIAGSGPQAVSCYPGTGAELAAFPTATAADLPPIFAAARAGGREWFGAGLRARAQVMSRLGAEIYRHRAEILDILQAETGKARIHALDELMDMQTFCRFLAHNGPRLLRTRSRRGALPLLTKVRVRRLPFGVAAVITPWNYPLSLAVGDALACLMAGNAVVARPDTQGAIVLSYVRNLAVRCGLPAECWQVVCGRGSKIGPQLIARADFVYYTGSTAVGRTVGKQAGAELKPMALELGGKNPMIVCGDVDVAVAAAGAVRGAFPNAGQLCISIERIYVHERIYAEFVEQMRLQTEALRPGLSFDFRYNFGSITEQRQFEVIAAHVADAVAKGARVVTGGKPLPQAGPLVYAPTVLVDVPDSARLYREETFGPVVAIYPFSTDAEAVALANDTENGLNAAVWSRNPARAWAIARQIRAGSVNINETYAAAWGSHLAPVGGMGISGLGRRHGAEGLLELTEAQTIAQQRLLALHPTAWLPAERFAWFFTGALRLMQVLRLR